MDIQLLRTLISVADLGSFSAAAAELHCVQSNVTGRIRKLETHLGQGLFERGRGGAKLTPFGETAYRRATELLAHYDKVERELLDESDGAAPLRLGSMETTAAARLPTMIKELKEQCPKAPLSLQTGPTGKLLSLLWEHKIDAAFVAAPIDPDRFGGKVAFTETLVSVSAPGSDETGPLLAFASGCSYRSTAEEWLRKSGRLDTDIVEMGTFEGILGCVEAGLGFAVAPERAVKTYRAVDQLTLTPLPPAYRAVDTILAWRRDARPTQALKVLKALLDR